MVANYAPDVGYAWWLMERYWGLIARQLADRRRPALLVYPREGPIPENILSSGAEVRWLDFGARDQAGIKAIQSLIRREGVRSVYLTDRAYSDSLYLRLRVAGVERIVVHDHTPGDRPPIRGVKGLLKSAVRRIPSYSADRYVAVSEFVQRRMIDNAHVPPEKTVVVPNGVESVEWTDADRCWARAEFGLNSNDVVIGLVARAHRIKGIDVAIAAASHVVSSNSRSQFVFVGDGPYLPEFRAHVESAGLKGHFRFLGRRADARRLMAGFDIGLHPSHAEVGYCLAILEMMNAGLPVVVSDNPSVRGATEPNVTGLLFSDGDAFDCARAVLRLVESPALRRSLGGEARTRTQSQFSMANTTKAFVDNVACYL